jgi:hypothetical protein
VSVVLLLALVVHAGAHVAIAIALGRRALWQKAILAFLVPPLAPFWGFQVGLRMEVYAWAGALFVYASGVALA